MKKWLITGCLALWAVVFGFFGLTAVQAAPGTPRITFVMEGVAGYDRLLTTARDKAGYPLELQIIHNINEKMLTEEVAKSSLVVVITHGKDISRVEQFREKLQDFKDRGGVVVVPNIPEDNAIASINGRDHPDLQKYWINGGEENMARLLAYLGNRFLQMPVAVKPPLILPAMGIYHPERPNDPFQDLPSYLAWLKSRGTDMERPFVGIKFYKSTLAKGETKTLAATVGALEKRGYVAIPFYLMDSAERTEKGTFPELDLIRRDGKPLVSAMITFVAHGGPGPLEKRIEHLAGLDLPLVLAIETTQSVREWQDNPGGIPPFSVHTQLNGPEMRGVIDPIVVAGRQYTDTGDFFYVPIAGQVEKLVDRAVGLSRLRLKENPQKKVAILYYNYPPGKGNIGASYLNVPRSIEKILASLKTAGYQTETPGEKELLRKMLAGGLNIGSWASKLIADMVRQGNAVLLPEREYRRWFEALPESKRQEMVAKWGPPPGELMVYLKDGEKQLVLPVIRLGNIILAPQPQRTDISKVVESYHDKAVPPPHQYVAFYLWLKKSFGADALIHLGTHGTHEWLPGKEQGLAATDWPLLLAQDMPIVYPYIMDNVGEGMQAKRRGEAVLVSYMTPPLIAGGLYGELSNLHETIHLYFDAVGETIRDQYRITILDKVRELNIDKDMEIDVAKIGDFNAFVEQLHLKIHDIEQQRVPIGLHTFATMPEATLVAGTVQEMLGEEYKKQIEELTRKLSPGASLRQREEMAESKGKELLQATLVGGLEPGAAQAKILGASSDNMTRLLKTARQHYDSFYKSQEMPALLAALSARFVRPGPGGDPIRNPAALPTGRNLIAIDPSTMPNPTAWAAGKKLGDQLVQNYLERHGSYPDKVAFTLWSVEPMRNHGVNEAQVLYLLGVRPVWQKGRGGGRVVGLELIPRSELKRPRIDVVIAASGLFRDTLPNLVHLLDSAVKMAASQDESDNYVRIHSAELYHYLTATGMSAADAKKFSTGRIFSNQEGSYGAGLDDAVAASNTWDNEKPLADLYFNNKGYLYGTDVWGAKSVDYFKQVLKGTKAVQLSRSSNLYGILTGDDPFQYLGGLGMAVRTLDGKTPELWIANLRNPAGPKMETASSFLRSEVRARYWNPLWIDGVMKEGYAGGREVSKTIENLWGWDVMDPTIVDDAMWDEFKQVYVDDKYNKGIKEWFAQNNPDAYQSIVGRMLEVIRKGYWNASEQTVAQLKAEYQASLAANGNSGAVHVETPQMKEFMTKNYQQRPAVDTNKSDFRERESPAAPQQPDVAREKQQAPEETRSPKVYEIKPAEARNPLELDDSLMEKIFIYAGIALAGLAFAGGAGYWLQRKRS